MIISSFLLGLVPVIFMSWSTYWGGLGMLNIKMMLSQVTYGNEVWWSWMKVRPGGIMSRNMWEVLSSPKLGINGEWESSLAFSALTLVVWWQDGQDVWSSYILNKVLSTLPPSYLSKWNGITILYNCTWSMGSAKRSSQFCVLHELWRKARDRDVWHQVISMAMLHPGVRQ